MRSYQLIIHSASKKVKNKEITSENFQITRFIMSKIMQNLVVLMGPSNDASETPLKVGNMILNRFCIDEDAAFELSGVNYLKKSESKMYWGTRMSEAKTKLKGKEYSFLRSFILRNSILMIHKS